MGQLVGENGLEFLVIEQVDELRGDDDDARPAAADGEGVWHAHVGDHQAGLFEICVPGDPLDGAVDLGVAVLRHVLRTGAPQRDLLADDVLETGESDGPEEDDRQSDPERLDRDYRDQRVEGKEDASDDSHPGFESRMSHVVSQRGFVSKSRLARSGADRPRASFSVGNAGRPRSELKTNKSLGDAGPCMRRRVLAGGSTDTDAEHAVSSAFPKPKRP